MESIIEKVLGERKLKITEVYYEELKSKNFENCRVGLRASVTEGESADAVLINIRKEVREQLGKWYNGDLYEHYDQTLEEKRKQVVELDSKLAQIRKKIIKTQEVLGVLED